MLEKSASQSTDQPQIKRTATHKSGKRDIQRAKMLRREASPVERKLWSQLSLQSESCGVRFRRQHPIHPYVVDFACLPAKIVVEIDGLSHDSSANQDRARDSYLKSKGYEVLRFSNSDVVTNTVSVVNTILAHVNAKIEGSK